jgi:hypothetical protein
MTDNETLDLFQSALTVFETLQRGEEVLFGVVRVLVEDVMKLLLATGLTAEAEELAGRIRLASAVLHNEQPDTAEEL